jgi:hypothetical protein
MSPNKTIEDKIDKTEKIEWKNLNDLQPINFKVNYHAEKTKQSIIENGFARAIYVWKNPENNLIYIVDGHCRKDILLELENEGYKIPEKLNCTFLDNSKISTIQEAIKLLIIVFNIKTNPIEQTAVNPFLEEYDIPLEDIKLDTLNIVDIEAELKFAKENLETQAQELAKQNELLSKNQNIDTMKTDSKFIFTFEPLQYESILRDFEELKEKTGFKTNELVLMEILNFYIENN